MVALPREDVFDICEITRVDLDLRKKVKTIDPRFVLHGPYFTNELDTIAFSVDCYAPYGGGDTATACITRKDVQDCPSVKMLITLVEIKVLDAAEELKAFIGGK
jgi:hypothetical protein